MVFLSVYIGVHTHHVLSQIAGSPLLAEEQAHSEHSEETAHPHETTGDSSPAESSQPEEQPPVCTCTCITILASLLSL